MSGEKSKNPTTTKAPGLFDTLLEQIQQQQQESAKDITGVTVILRSAGVDERKIAELVSNPSSVAMITAHPELAQAYAVRFPSTHVVDYYAIEQQLGFETRLPTSAPLGDAAAFLTTGTPEAPEPTDLARAGSFLTTGELPAGPTEQGIETSDNGGIRHANGVIVDTTNGVVAFPQDAKVEGSSLWLQGATKWNDKEVAKQRRILAKNGYLESAEGGKDVQFFDALKQFHENRYLYGGGDPVPLTTSNDAVTRKDFGGLLDPAILRSEVRNWFRAAYGDEGSDPEVDFFAQRVAKVAMSVARKQKYSPTDAAQVARATVQEEFMDEPSVEMRLDQAHDDMESTRLRDSIVGVGGMLGAFSGVV